MKLIGERQAFRAENEREDSRSLMAADLGARDKKEHEGWKIAEETSIVNSPEFSLFLSERF